jgi:hypothetical protein
MFREVNPPPDLLQDGCPVGEVEQAVFVPPGGHGGLGLRLEAVRQQVAALLYPGLALLVCRHLTQSVRDGNPDVRDHAGGGVQDFQHFGVPAFVMNKLRAFNKGGKLKAA